MGPGEVAAVAATGGKDDKGNKEQDEDEDLELSATIALSIDEARFDEYLRDEETRMVALAKARS